MLYLEKGREVPIPKMGTSCVPNWRVAPAWLLSFEKRMTERVIFPIEVIFTGVMRPLQLEGCMISGLTALLLSAALVIALVILLVAQFQ